MDVVRLNSCLDFRIGIETCHFLFEDQVRAHTPSSEGPNTSLVLGAQRVRVEVTHAAVPRILEQFDGEERALRVLRAETQILIKTSGLLIVQVDVEEFARVNRLRDRVREAQASHRFVCEFWVEAEQF